MMSRRPSLRCIELFGLVRVMGPIDNMGERSRILDQGEKHTIIRRPKTRSLVQRVVR